MRIIRRDDQSPFRRWEDGFWEPFDDFLPLAFRPSRWMAFPKVDVSETENEVTVVANVPGIDPDKIEIEADGESVTISGKLEKEEEEKEKRFYRYEREYGEFRRVIPLPSPVDSNKVRATSKNGVLTITLPKAESAKKKKVSVEVE